MKTKRFVSLSRWGQCREAVKTKVVTCSWIKGHYRWTGLLGWWFIWGWAIFRTWSTAVPSIGSTLCSFKSAFLYYICTTIQETCIMLPRNEICLLQYNFYKSKVTNYRLLISCMNSDLVCIPINNKCYVLLHMLYKIQCKSI